MIFFNGQKLKMHKAHIMLYHVNIIFYYFNKIIFDLNVKFNLIIFLFLKKIRTYTY